MAASTRLAQIGGLPAATVRDIFVRCRFNGSRVSVGLRRSLVDPRRWLATAALTRLAQVGGVPASAVGEVFGGLPIQPASAYRSVTGDRCAVY
ncbi:hypothetical protein ACIOD2_28040 [Amycolatopsis sp. NPDC088138]|uniref:hypothetical protein n=1 Tax=Amycolatopsis sp. NPDC088138 TaxID=3363938 RepID=UPI0037F235AD